MEFDLRDGSHSMKALESNMIERQKKKEFTRSWRALFPRSKTDELEQTEYEQAPYLTDEESELLDRVLDELGREESIRKQRSSNIG